MGETQRHPGSSCVLFYLGRSAAALQRWRSLTCAPGSLLDVFGNVDRKLLRAEDTKMSKGKEARNLRYVNTSPIVCSWGDRGNDSMRSRGTVDMEEAMTKAGSTESKLCLLSHFAKGQPCLRI